MENIRSLGVWDIREGVTLQRVTLSILGCRHIEHYGNIQTCLNLM